MVFCAGRGVGIDRVIAAACARLLSRAAEAGALYADRVDVEDRFGVCVQNDSQCSAAKDTGRDRVGVAVAAAGGDR